MEARVRAGRPHSEIARKITHIAMGGFALLLRYLSWWQAALLALAALLFNLFVLPRIGHQLYRPGDRDRTHLHGIVFYPASVLLLVLLFPDRLDIVAAAWGILAVGDGMATIVGQWIGGAPIPWNRDKSVAGSGAFLAFGGLAAMLLLWWCRTTVSPPPGLLFVVAAPFVAALVAALVETVPIRLDDNISVPASAAGTLWALSLVDPSRAAAAVPALQQAVLPALAANVVVAFLGYKARTVTAAGAVTGATIGTIVAAAAGWQAWALLVVTFLAASASSRLGIRRKALLGIAEERGGRRGPGNAIANTGLAAIAALLSLLIVSRDLALLGFVAALAAGGSDTIASEIGKAWGRSTYSVPTFKPVLPGTSGAMSLEGTAAGIVGALAIATAAAALGLVPSSALLVIVAAATIGSLVESLLGATLEGPGILNNDALNFLNTGVAAATAILLARTTS
jgi:uncharacterized protein (TIGR00297 family)